ncbi:MAG: cytochrome ubiquinol oxidase subunit [Pseudonocardia sp.]|uniref:cytochrome ubiquinol oxidase subunit I n=1 Tax=Pseudonocardia sp. TaxID=60912 RepID=UPI00260E57D1|nr:cytochrome ubiquinol oxidase subunit I [Pseudonocardia sp.]MCU1628681.1 cytochrome ubiquinol oxidase subunit [Pseudonocardia sp.]
MDQLDLARWQFGITTVYHFFFVPLTIGMAWVVAGFETAWVRTGNPVHRRLTMFFGRLFMIVFVLGTVTGIVQEFQFGMNWSAYSRFVGDVFGPPLAFEGLLAFFLEATFIGLWIFGWDRLGPRLHLATIYLVAVGSLVSAFFILAANSWMQHPVGFVVDREEGRAELTDLGAVLTNSTTLVAVYHTLSAAFLTAGAFVLGVSAWQLWRRGDSPDAPSFRRAARAGMWMSLAAGVAVLSSGHVQGVIMTQQQPMKIAAAEALYHTEQPAAFSLITIGTLDGSREIWSVKVPGLLSFLATGSFDGRVEGIYDLQDRYVQQFGPGDYRPVVPLTYWTYRLMIGCGALAVAIAATGLWLTRRGRQPASPWFHRAAVTAIGLPLLANSFGWIFTEMGRQPWVVWGQMRTAAGVSPTVGAGTVLTSMIVFTLLYGALAVVGVLLLRRHAAAGLPAEEPDPEDREQRATVAY